MTVGMGGDTRIEIIEAAIEMSVEEVLKGRGAAALGGLEARSGTEVQRGEPESNSGTGKEKDKMHHRLTIITLNEWNSTILQGVCKGVYKFVMLERGDRKSVV